MDERESLERIGSLVAELETVADPAARERARALVQAILDIHRAGLARALELAPAEVIEALAAEPPVALLLSLHGLHPRALESRVRDALGEVAPALGAQGVTVELDRIDEDVVRLKVRGDGVAAVRASPARLRAAVEGAIGRRAPEVAQVAYAGLDTDLVQLGKHAPSRG